MSTKYYAAKHSTDVEKTAEVAVLRADTDNPKGTLRMLIALNKIEPLRKNNWKIRVTNYDGSKIVQKNVNWKYLTMHLTAGDVFSLLT